MIAWWMKRQLRSPEQDVRLTAAIRVGVERRRDLAPQLLPLLQDEAPSVRVAAARSLATLLVPAAIAPLAAALDRAASAPRGHVGTWELEALSTALVGCGREAALPLLPLLGSESRVARQWAARTLGELGEPRAARRLTELLEDDRSDVRVAAAGALPRCGVTVAPEALARALGHRDPETRRAAAEALGRIGDPAAVEILRSATDDDVEPVQLAVISALSRLGGAVAGELLSGLLDGGRRSVREAAAAALSTMRLSPPAAADRAAMAVLTGHFDAAVAEGAVAVGPLLEALGAGSAETRRGAACALAALGPPSRALAPICRLFRDGDVMVQEAAAAALIRAGAAAVPTLLGALTGADIEASGLAARALGVIGDSRAVIPLADTIGRHRGVSSRLPAPLLAARGATTALNLIMKAHAAAVSPDGLRRVAEVPDVLEEHQVGDDEDSRWEKMVIDNAVLRGLARHELERRGLG